METPEERKALVEQIIAENPNLTPSYLEILANYLILCMEKQEKKEKKILTENRLMTVNKRETSFEGLSDQLENGEDGIYNLIANDKNIIFQHKVSITKKDLENIPELKQLKQEINIWDTMLKRTSGRDAYTIKKALIEMRKDQYIIKQAYLRPLVPNKVIRSNNIPIYLKDKSYFNPKKNELHIEGVSLMNYKVVSAILCNYSRLKQDSYGNFESDTWFLIQDFEHMCDKALADYPLYKRLLECKIDGLNNQTIQETLEKEFNIKHSLEYISSLWKNKIPKLIAVCAQNEYLIWCYQKNNIPMKKCSKCGQLKPAHNNFFSRNKTSKDGFYSICKKCRNKKRGE